MEPLSRSELTHYLEILKKKWKLILGTVLIFSILAASVSFILPKIYRGTLNLKIVLGEKSTPLSLKEIRELVAVDLKEKKSEIFSDLESNIDDFSIIELKSLNQLQIRVDSQKPEIIEKATRKFFNFVVNHHELKYLQNQYELDLNARISELSSAIVENDFLLKSIGNLLRKEKLTSVDFNPAEVSRKTYELKLERQRLIEEKRRLNSLLRQVNNINISKYPVKPDKRIIVLISALVGLLIGSVIAFLLERRSLKNQT